MHFWNFYCAYSIFLIQRPRVLYQYKTLGFCIRFELDVLQKCSLYLGDAKFNVSIEKIGAQCKDPF